MKKKITIEEFSKRLRDWLKTPAEERNLEQGAIYVLQITNSVVLYKYMLCNLEKHAEYMEIRIRRYLRSIRRRNRQTRRARL